MKLISRWGRGHPEEYTEAINLGEEGYDSMEDKKPRAGQILWIRGLTRLQTQVSNRFPPLSCHVIFFILLRLNKIPCNAILFFFGNFQNN